MSQPQTNKRHHSARAGARRGRDVTSPLGPIGGARTLVRMIGRAARVQAYEVGLMAALVAMAPLRLASDRFEPVVGTLSPVKAPGSTACPVLLVHGFGGTKSSWSFLARSLSLNPWSSDFVPSWG